MWVITSPGEGVAIHASRNVGRRKPFRLGTVVGRAYPGWSRGWDYWAAERNPVGIRKGPTAGLGPGIGSAGGVLLEDPVVALFLEFEGQFLAAGAQDAAVGEDVDKVGDDVIEQPLVMGDDQLGGRRTA